MIDKFWYQNVYALQDNETTGSRKCIQKFIDLYFNDIFNVPEDITMDNIKDFLERLLKYYEHYYFEFIQLINIGESIVTYFSHALIDENLERGFPEYSKSDRRNLVLDILWELYSSQTILPEDVPFLIQYLNTTDDKVLEARALFENYFDQFDIIKRTNKELPRRYKILEQQRLEAIEKWQPIPIRPMGIELDMCYLKKLNQAELLELVRQLYKIEIGESKAAFSDFYGTLRFNNINVIDFYEHMKERKLSPEEILEKTQNKDV
jgi:hypothetical protein